MGDPVLERIINEDATLRALFTPPRQPRYRYWQSDDGTIFLYTTETFSDGKYGSAVMAPVGKGSRSGRRAVSEWRPTREVHHKLRRQAKARALALWRAHEAGA